MMTNTGGFQSNFTPSSRGGYNGGAGCYGNNANLQRSQTYAPPSPFPNPNFPPQQPYAQNTGFHHTNTYMPPQPPSYPPQQPNPYPPQPAYPPQAPSPYARANTYMPQQQPYPNPPAYPPQQPIAPAMPARTNTYMPTLARPPTIYDQLGPVSNPPPTVPLTAPVAMPLSPAPFGPGNSSPERDCQILHDAVHGAGTNERAIIDIIVNRNWAERLAIRSCYKSSYGKDLVKRLKEDTSGNFKDVVAGMFMTPAEYDAMCLYKAMKGLGTNEGVLIEIIGTRTNQELTEIKTVFNRDYGQTLEKWVRSETSGNFRNLLVALLQCNRSMNPNPDPNMCQNDAQVLYKAGEGRWGTDESTFIRIFASRSAAEMAMINNCYTRLRGKGLLKAIDNEFSGDIKKLLETVVGGLLDPAGYFAKRIRDSVKGVGTNDSRLVRVIVSRSEKDLGFIKQAYQRIYGRDLLHDVRDDTSGYYKEILTGLIARC
jgi:annexin A7/11